MARTPDPTVRLALIEAAARLLATEGFEALSIRRVASEVGRGTTFTVTIPKEIEFAVRYGGVPPPPPPPVFAI